VYAYVSRGRVRAYPHPSDYRASVYSAADVETLRKRKEARRNPEVAAKENLAWGMPVLESSITLIRDGRLYYRGRDVVTLAAHESVGGPARRYLNRLSDLLFILARGANDGDEPLWRPGAGR